MGQPGLQALVDREATLNEQIDNITTTILDEGPTHPQYKRAELRIEQLTFQQKIIREVLGAIIGAREEEVEHVLRGLNEHAGLDQGTDPLNVAFRDECEQIRLSILELLKDRPAPDAVVLESTGTAPNMDIPLENKDKDQPVEMEHIDRVILPPGSGKLALSGLSKEEWLEKMGGPRCELLRGLLRDDLRVHFREIVGTVSPDSMRQKPYHAFLVPELKCIFFVNDEYGEATFLVRNCKNLSEDFDRFSRMNKDELRRQKPDDVYRISYPGDPQKWLDILKYILLQDPDYKSLGRDPVSLSRIIEVLCQQVGLKRIRGDSLIPRLELIAQMLHAWNDGSHKQDTGATSRLGNPIYAYDPQFAETAIDILAVLYKPNEGWKTLSGIKDELCADLIASGRNEGVNFLTVEAHLNRVLASMDTATVKRGTGMFLVGGNIREEERLNNPFGLKTHYSPDLVRKVKESVTKEIPPNEWRSVFWIHSQTGSTEYIIGKLVDKLKDTDPRFQVGYFRESGPHTSHIDGLKLHLNPPLVAEVTKQIGLR